MPPLRRHHYFPCPAIDIASRPGIPHAGSWDYRATGAASSATGLHACPGSGDAADHHLAAGAHPSGGNSNSAHFPHPGSPLRTTTSAG